MYILSIVFVEFIFNLNIAWNLGRLENYIILQSLFIRYFIAYTAFVEREKR